MVRSIGQFGARTKPMHLKPYDRVAYVGPAELFDKITPDDVGFIIEVRDEQVFEVEFSRANGETYALHVIPARYLVAKHE